MITPDQARDVQQRRQTNRENIAEQERKLIRTEKALGVALAALEQIQNITEQGWTKLAAKDVGSTINAAITGIANLLNNKHTTP